MIIIIHSKYFAIFDWLQSPPLILHKQNGAYHIRKMRAIYHWFDGTFDWKRGWSMDNRPLINRLKRTCVYILKLCRKIGRSLKESLQGGKLVKNFKIFWTNYWISLSYDVKNYTTTFNNYLFKGNCLFKTPLPFPASLQ